MKNKSTYPERVAAKLLIAKNKKFARTLKEVTDEQDQPRVAASARNEEDGGF